jgi:tetratricopeptide (TPR) repeat protein
VLDAYRELERYLAAERVPRHLRGWAERQLGLARRAYAVQAEAIPQPRSAARTPADDLPDFFEDDQVGVPVLATRRATPSAEQQPRQAGKPGRTARRRSAGWRSLTLVLALGLAVIGLAIGNPQLFPGKAGSAPPGGAPAARESAVRPLSQTRVAELSALVERDPRNVGALFELGEMHFEAQRWQESIDWFTRLLEVDPGNIHARTDIGTAHFNLRRFDLARQVWEEVAAMAPDDPQIHYNLGFLYANSDERDLERAFREWEMVVTLAPGSDLARTAQAHLDALRRR